MKHLTIFSLLLLSSFSSIAQETEYKKALDSLNFYLRFTTAEPYYEAKKTLRVVSCYRPSIYNPDDDASSNEIFNNRAKGSKQVIILSDGSHLYILDLKQIDTSFFKIYRNNSLRIQDPKGKYTFVHSMAHREGNGRGGMIEEVLTLYPYPIEKSAIVYQKINYFFRKVVLSSRKVK